MFLMQDVREAVTAKQAGQMYGLKFDMRGNKAVCPWHRDHSPSLSFKGNRCKCFSCNNGGDAIDLTAQIFGISTMEAAKKLQADFGVGVPVDARSVAKYKAKRDAAEKARADALRRYNNLCDIENSARMQLMAWTDPETAWDDPRFVQTLKRFSDAQDALNGWSAVHCD